MLNNIEDSKRMKEFRRWLISNIPRSPNNKTSLHAIESKPLTSLLIISIGWALRSVAVRKRKVTGIQNLHCDPRAVALTPNIDAFLAEVEAGNDLTPYLSLEPRSRGYAPSAEGHGPNVDSWADKDFLLNVMGFHHFHLGITREAAGHAARTNELIFAFVTRDEFEILGLFNHAAFEHEDDHSMTPERSRLWAAYEAREQSTILPGQFSLGGFANLGIATSGHPIAVVRIAQRHVQIICDVDPKLDDPEYLKTIYGDGVMPKKPKLKWRYNHLDFGLYDEPANLFAILHKGPN